MRDYVASVRFNLTRAIKSSSFRYSLLCSTLIITVNFIVSCINLWGYDGGELPSAAVAWQGNYVTMGTVLFPMYTWIMLFPLCSAVFGDVLVNDTRSNRASMIVCRLSLTRYIKSCAIVSFFMGFISALIPLLVSQVLALISFPVTAGQDSLLYSLNSYAADATSVITYEVARMPFNEFFTNNRYLFNILFSAHIALWAGALSLCSYVISIYIKTNRLVVVGIPTVLLLLSSFFVPQNLIVIENLILSNGYPYEITSVAALLAIIVVCMTLAVEVSVRIRKDPLL